MSGAGHYAARRRRGATARQAHGPSRNTWRSRQSRQADMENALKRGLDEDPLSENAPGPKRKTSSDPGPSFESDAGNKCRCTGECRCLPQAVRFSEEPAFEVEVETEAQDENDSQCSLYSYNICGDCRARLGKKLDVRAESCAMALLELRYGAAAREGGLARGDCVQHGGPPTEQRSGPRANGGLADRTPPEPTQRSLVSSGASDADETMGTLLKLKRCPGCSCSVAGAGTGCHECCAPNAATSGLGDGPSGRSAAVLKPRASAAAGAPDGPRSSSGFSTSAVVIHLTAGDKTGDGTNSEASAAASPEDALPVMANEYAEKNAGPSHE